MKPVDTNLIKAYLSVLSYPQLSRFLEKAKKQNAKRLLKISINELHYRADLLIPDHKLYKDLNLKY